MACPSWWNEALGAARRRFAHRRGQVTSTGTGTHIEWNIELVPKARYSFLEIVLRLNRAQLVRDMRWFRAALDEQYPSEHR